MRPHFEPVSFPIPVSAASLVPTSAAATVTVESPRVAAWRVPALYLELGKARLSLLVVLTASVGFVVAPVRPIDWAGFGWVSAGTLLLALGANGLNEWLEADRDALMQRTAGRPIPSGRMTRAHALLASLAMTALGVIACAAGNNTLTAILGAANVAIYVLAYTPLKPVSSLNTLVGAICGAIPPMMGWSAATGGLSAGAYVLAAVLFVWQIPHSLALAYLYRDDYAAGGYRMLPNVDPGGRLTFHVVNLHCLALVPVAFLATPIGVAGGVFAAGAVVLGGFMVVLGLVLWRRRGAADARRLFLATLLYLPLLLALMVWDRGPL